MSVRFLLDTNIASYVIKGSFPQVRERLVSVPVSEVGISVVTEAELRFGVAVARLPQAAKLGIAVEEFLLRVDVLAWNSAAARSYARLRAVLEERDEPMGNLDLMIAAQALAAETILVTNDRVYRRVKGLRIEDWSNP